MDVHHVALRIEVHIPYLLQQRGASHDFLGMEHEVFEELKLLRRDVERLVTDSDLVTQTVERDGAVAQDVEPLGTSSAVECPDPGQELVELEGLGEVVVGAG